MKTILRLMVLFILVLFIAGCPAEPVIPAPEVTTLYTAGYVYNSVADRTTARIWTDGISEDLTDGTYSAKANSVYVSGADIYAAGSETTDTLTVYGLAKYWKNGAEVILGEGIYYSQAYSIFVDGSNVYACGLELNSSGIEQAKYWINGTAVVLGSGLSHASANSIYVTSTYIYIAGYELGDPNGNSSNYDIAKFWKIDKLSGTTEEVILNTDQDKTARANSIIVSDSDVYVTGREDADPDGNTEYNPTVKLWKIDSSGSKVIDITLSNSGNWSGGRGISLSGADIYVVGYENQDLNSDGTSRDVAKLWKVDSTGAVTETTSLSDGTSDTTADSIFSDNGNIYVVGTNDVYDPVADTFEYTAKYWENSAEGIFSKQIAARGGSAIVDGSTWGKSVFIVTE